LTAGFFYELFGAFVDVAVPLLMGEPSGDVVSVDAEDLVELLEVFGGCADRRLAVLEIPVFNRPNLPVLPNEVVGGRQLLDTLINRPGSGDGAKREVVIEGLDGALYGTAYGGGEANRGVIFRLNKDGSRCVVLSSLGLNHLDPWGSYTSLLLAKDAFFYGTTIRGGDSDFGTIFQLAQSPAILSIGMSGPAVQLRLSGIPGHDYSVEAKGALDSPTWTGLGVRTAGTNGLFAFDDLDSGGRPISFYRAVAQ